MPGTVLCAIFMVSISHLLLTAILWGSNNYYPYFTGKRKEAWES